jgi:integrase
MNVFKRKIGGVEQEFYSVKFQHKGKQFLKGLKTSNLAEARKRAADFYRVTTAAEWIEVREALSERIAGKSDSATLREVVERYMALALDVKQRAKNVACLRRVVEAGFPGRTWDLVRVAELTKETVRRFVDGMLGRIGQVYKRYEASEGRVMSEYSVRTTIKSTLRCARSVFAKGHARHFEDLRLGDLSSFLEEPVEGPKRRKPMAPDSEAIRAMVAAVPGLKASSPRVYCAFVLMAYCGLRPIEVRHCRRSWFREVEGGFVLDVVDRDGEGFSAKGNEGSVPVSREVMGELEEFAGLRTDGFMVPGRTPTERARVVERDLSGFVGQFLRGRSGTQTSYELRRWAGSRVLDAHNGDVTAARDFLRHADIKTTLEWYAYRINGVKALGLVTG